MLEVDRFSLSLLVAAAGIAVTHTVLGPDHYLPFLMLARARGWSRARTLLVTAGCGVGHVLSSIALGAVGLAIGAGVGWIQVWEGQRGDWAAWALVAFGCVYMLWGLRQGIKRYGGVEMHEHGGRVHVHFGGRRHHHHADAARDGATSFWTLFIVFVLGPCEPLIPLFVLPASRGAWGLAAAVGGAFGVVTIVSMLALVLIGHAGLSRLPLAGLERWAHAMAGAVVMASGLAVIFLGL
jgi:hypothetical protein